MDDVTRKWAAFCAFLRVDALLSQEYDTIKKAKQNDAKYASFVNIADELRTLPGTEIVTIDDVRIASREHTITLQFDTAENEIEFQVSENKTLANAIEKADASIWDTDINGNARLFLIYKGIYEEAEGN